MGKKKDRKPLIDYIRSIDEKVLSKIDLNRSLSNKPKEIAIEDYLKDTNRYKKFLLIDCRSEKEFRENSIPGFSNFPILTDSERDDVGFLYKHFSKQGAIYLALEYAKKKLEKLNQFVLDHNKKDIIVHCWRGGGRSMATAHFLIGMGYNVYKISGGIKSFRRVVYNQFYEDSSNLSFLILSGLTGSGKTEILEYLEGKLPIFNIEKAADHASSLFGKIRFGLEEKVYTQMKFETNLFREICFNGSFTKPMISESESKNIHKFKLPENIFNNLVKSPTIVVDTSLEVRSKRIVKDYFKGKKPKEVYNVLESSRFLKKIIGGNNQKMLLKMIEEKKYYEFSEWFLKNYYDKRYSSSYSNVVATFNGDNIEKCIDRVVDFYEDRLKQCKKI
ncbi:MAG: tRNA 2-selenouridine(34) synthase MnmH [Candidatus Delongbacteria bacterium]|nr:MAG: tRNA 2-selenouridine(34) synthase MnmH [Candidatus Delongbacteria bacterium]